MKFNLAALGLAIGFVVFGAAPAMAHIIVYPGQANTNYMQVFYAGVINEQLIPTVAVKVVIPSDISFTVPAVKPGWDVGVTTSGPDDGSRITEITWTGGAIPPHQRDEFGFSAVTPGSPSTLRWNAYQTFSDGSTVAWDHKPVGDSPDPRSRPYSVTKVLTPRNDDSPTAFAVGWSEGAGFALVASILAVIISVVSLIVLSKRRLSPPTSAD